MMTNVLSAERQATLVATALWVTTAKSLDTLPKTAPTKSLHLETPCHVPGHVMTTTIETDHSPLTTYTALVDALTSHVHTLGNNHARIQHIGITMTHLDHATFPTRVTLKVTPQTKANLVPAALTILLEDHTHRK